LPKTFTCIICPNSCEISIDKDNIIGAKCKRGELFVKQEIIKPKRILTTTIKCVINGKRYQIPVKSEQAIELKHFNKIIEQLKKITLDYIPKLGALISINSDNNGVKILVTGE
jgi:CxxC motif-containing protein